MVAHLMQSENAEHGLRYMDPRRDMGAVVDLIQAAFGDEIDPEGQRVLREMRLAARLAPWLGSWILGPGVYGSMIVGFVWLEGGQVVGHATVQRVDYEGSRWQIANVAVAAPYRGRGIGRALMEASLEHIRGQHGQWAVLQVRANNAPAVHLYRSLGFEEVGGESRWEADLSHRWPVRPTTPAVRLTSVSYRHFMAVQDLRARSLAEGGRWWWANRSPQLERTSLTTWLKRVLGLRTLYRWGYWEGKRLLACVTLLLDRTTRRAEFMVQVDRAHWGQWEDALIAWTVREAATRGMKRLSTRADLEHQALLESLRRAGFQERLRLLNMRKRIE